MTGNNKVWRAPVAGLASVAMLATMGVAAANAAETTPTKNYEVTVGSESFTAWPNETIADAYYRYTTQMAKPAESNFAAFASAPEGQVFVGFVDASGNSVNMFTDPVTSNMTLTPKYVAAGEAVKVEFAGVNGYSEPKVFLPYGATFYVAKNSTIGDAAPVDAADGQVVTAWNIDYADPDKKDTTTTDIASFDVADPAPGETVTISPVADKVEQAKTATFGASVTNAHVAGAYSDGDGDNAKYSVDSVNGKVTVPDFVYDGTQTTVDKVTSWKNPSGGTVAFGDQVDPTNYTAVNTTKGYKVVFDSNGGSAVPAQWVEAGYFADEPAAPTRDGKVFKGWKKGSDYFDFEADAVNEPTTLVAEWDDASVVTVTFTAGTYKGAPKDVEVKLDSDEFLEESQAPDWTRDGYVLAGWTYNDSAFDFDKQVVGDVVAGQYGQDFTLTAKWVKVDEDIAKAALRYVHTDIESADADLDLNKQDSDEKYFTSASWKEFAPVWKAAYKKYETAKYNAPQDKISAETAAEIVSDLKAGWEKLVFTHASQADAMGKKTVHRLYKDGEHFYTKDAKEVAYMTNKLTTSGGWDDEGRLFEAAPDAGRFADFTFAAKDDAQIAADLDEVADPIVIAINRAYNKANGDHVWTADPNEYEVLSNQADWNAEGVAFYVPTFTGTTDVVRLYKNNRHLLSTDSNEVKVLSTKQGWSNEGTAFLGY